MSTEAAVADVVTYGHVAHWAGLVVVLVGLGAALIVFTTGAWLLGTLVGLGAVALGVSTMTLGAVARLLAARQSG